MSAACAEKKQVVLVKNSLNAAEIISSLTSVGMFTCKAVEQCPVDVMFCAQAGVAPAVPFVLVTPAKDVVHQTKERLRQATSLFPFVHGIILFPMTFAPAAFRGLQMLHFDTELTDKVQLVPVSSMDTLVHYMLAIRSKRTYANQSRAAEYYARLWAQVESKDHAKKILQSNMPFLHEDECDMLLDVFGSIAGLSRVSEQTFLDSTVLDADVVQLILEYFQPLAVAGPPHSRCAVPDHVRRVTAKWVRALPLPDTFLSIVLPYVSSGDRRATRRITCTDLKKSNNEPPAATETCSPRDAAATQALCQRRVNQRVVQDMVLKTRLLEDEQSKHARNREVSLRAAHTATERIKAKKQKELQALDDGVEVLILNQPSSIEAMNIARMLSPRFAETIHFTPEVTKNSVEEGRLKALLEGDRIGSYYR
ncbi:Aste57867_12960 [Aphanomyces stellatus]|uniref:Aste57867_12960 protein n=1 Tax=Aphanomyces stellatus TaxID=120398 RepID=A0A485KXT2_9STRA|nr:hypothetical protein As57867_012912 [Aphanomyces stellatus]VFT89806.1 Aste57867_12960 [Aphanomyces stellatus]